MLDRHRKQLRVMGALMNKCTQPEEGERAPQRAKANEHDKAVLQLKVARDKVTKFKKKAHMLPVSRGPVVGPEGLAC